MNPIKKLFEEITDSELREAILEIKESNDTGFIKVGGYIRKYAKLTAEITGGFSTTDFYMTTVNLLQQAAFRWIQK